MIIPANHVLALKGMVVGGAGLFVVFPISSNHIDYLSSLRAGRSECWDIFHPLHSPSPAVIMELKGGGGVKGNKATLGIYICTCIYFPLPIFCCYGCCKPLTFRDYNQSAIILIFFFILGLSLPPYLSLSISPLSPSLCVCL